MHRLKPVLLSAIFLLLANACGLQGPLYLPEADAPEPQTGNEQADVQADEEKDKEDGGIHEENS